MSFTGSTLEHRTASLAGLRLHYVEQGEGPLTVLLHGFPEFWLAWDRQIPALAGAGFRVVAPDLRGFNLSACPLKVCDYRIDSLADDITRLIRHCGCERASLVGRGLGGLVAWTLAMRHPAMVDRIAVLNAPHPSRLMMTTTWRWQGAAWLLFAQVPWLPEDLLHARGCLALRWLMRELPPRSDTFSAEETERFVAASARMSGLTGGFHAMRALVRGGAAELQREAKVVEIPSLVITGGRDPIVAPSGCIPDRGWAPRLESVTIAEASHWVQAEQPGLVTALLQRFLTGNRSSAKAPWYPPSTT